MDYPAWKTFQRNLTEVDAIRHSVSQIQGEPVVNMFQNRMYRLYNMGPRAANMTNQDMRVMSDFTKITKTQLEQQNKGRLLDSERVIDPAVENMIQFIDDRTSRIHTQLKEFYGKSQVAA